MNLLVLSFGRNLHEDYYVNCLNRIFADADFSALHLDIMSLEHTFHLKKMEYDKSESLVLRLKGIIPVHEAVSDEIFKIVKSKNVDAVVCTGPESLWYVEHSSVDIPVFCFIFDTSSVKCDSCTVTKYFLLSEIDREKLIASGFDEAKLSVTGLIGSSNIIGKLDARKELSMYFVDEVCVYLTDGKDFERVVQFFDIVLKSPLRNTNFVVVSTKSRTFCDVFNARYSRYENIGAIFSTKNINLYLSSADFVLVDTNAHDAFVTVINNKPFIVTEQCLSYLALIGFLNDRCLAFCKKDVKDIVETLDKLISNSFIRDNLLISQKEIINDNSDNIILNDIINKIYIKKGNENEQQSSS